MWGERAGAQRSAGARTNDSLPDTAHDTTTDENVFHPERSRDANLAKKLRAGASVGGWEEKQTRAHSHLQGALPSAWRLSIRHCSPQHRFNRPACVNASRSSH
jgi:hypothetical protein